MPAVFLIGFRGFRTIFRSTLKTGERRFLRAKPKGSPAVEPRFLDSLGLAVVDAAVIAGRDQVVHMHVP